MFSSVLLIFTIGFILNIDAANTSTRLAIVNEYWCYQAKYCRSTGVVVCAKDWPTQQAQYFPDQCAVFNYNCKNKMGFTVTAGWVCETISSTATAPTKITTTRIRLPIFK